METPLSRLINALKNLQGQGKVSLTNPSVASSLQLKQSLEKSVKKSLPQIIHHQGKSSEGPDFYHNNNFQPTKPKLKNYLSDPVYQNNLSPYAMNAIKISGQYNYLLKKTDDELLNILRDTLLIGTFGKEYEKLANKLVAHLKAGKDYSKSPDFTDTSILSNLIVKTHTFRKLKTEITLLFRKRMSNSKISGDFTRIKYLLLNNKNLPDLENFPFGIGFFSSPTLKTLMGGVQELEISLAQIDYIFQPPTSSNPNHPNVFKAILNLIIYDDFGLSEDDIENASFMATLGMEGLLALWILQRQRNHCPFRTVFKFHIHVDGMF